MTTLTLRASLAGAIIAAAFGASSAFAHDTDANIDLQAVSAITNDDKTSCIPHGPRRFHRMRRHAQCIRLGLETQSERQSLAENEERPSYIRRKR